MTTAEGENDVDIIGKQTSLTGFLEKLDPDEKNDLDHKVQSVIKAVAQTGSAGSVTITYVFKRNGDNGVQCEIAPKYKEPAKKPGTRLLFLKFDDNLQPTGELSEYPHKQEPLPLLDGKPRIVRPS